MQRIITNSNHILRFDHVLDKGVCNDIVQHALSVKGTGLAGKGEMPWHDNDTVLWHAIPNEILVQQIIQYRNLLCNIINECFQSTVYTEYTDIVIWRKGKSHPRHKDNGYPGDNPSLSNRIYTSITYLNDDYTGGQTFISTEHGYDYVSVPKVGSVVIFPSDNSAAHGVYEVTEGIRITLPIWFCNNYDVSEDKRLDRN